MTAAVNNTSWMAGGLCVQIGHGGEPWFPEKGESTHVAKTVCRRCPVLHQCRGYGLADSSLHGIWGGLTAKERQKIRDQSQREVAA